MQSQQPQQDSEYVWHARPWITPPVLTSTVTLAVLAAIVIVAEIYYEVAYMYFFGLPIYQWTLFGLLAAWLSSMVDQLIFWATNKYELSRQDLEVTKGIIDSESFIVAPDGFGDLAVKRSLGGRIFGYADLTVNTQGNKKIRMYNVRNPAQAAEIILGVLGKPVVRVENN
jgi:uncharacterized membrane protein YdbT with pleckstrin-like domain